MEDCPPKREQGKYKNKIKYLLSIHQENYSATPYLHGLHQEPYQERFFFVFSIRYFTISVCDSMSNAIFQCRPPLRCDGIMYDTCAIRQDAARLVLYLTQCHIFIPCHNESFIFCKYTSFPRTAQGTKRKTPGREASRLAAGRKIVLWSNAFERSRLMQGGRRPESCMKKLLNLLDNLYRLAVAELNDVNTVLQ